MTHSVKRALALLLALLLAVPTFAFAEPLDNDLEIAYGDEVETVDPDESVGEVTYDLSALTEAEPEAPPAQEAAEDDDAEVEVDLDAEEESVEEETSDEAAEAQDTEGEPTLEDLLAEEEEASEQEASDEAALEVSENDVARIGTKGFATLKEAILAAQLNPTDDTYVGNTIVLLKNITGSNVVPQDLTDPANPVKGNFSGFYITKEVELVLDGNTIDVSGATWKDANGIDISADDRFFACLSDGAAKLTVDGTEKGSEIKGATNAFVVAGSADNARATLVINGGSYTASGDVIQVPHEKYANISVTGAKLTAGSSGIAVFGKGNGGDAGKADLTVKNSTIKGTAHGIVAHNSTLTMTGTTIEAGTGILMGDDKTAGGTMKLGAGNDVTATTAISADGRVGACTVEIKGGSYKGSIDATASTVSVYDDAEFNGTVKATGGSLTLRYATITSTGIGVELYNGASLDMTNTVINAGGDGIYAHAVNDSYTSLIKLGAGNVVTATGSNTTYAVHADDGIINTYSSITDGTYNSTGPAVWARVERDISGYNDYRWVAYPFITGGLFSNDQSYETWTNGSIEHTSYYYDHDNYKAVQNGTLWRIVKATTADVIEVTEVNGDVYTVKVTTTTTPQTGDPVVTTENYTFTVKGKDSTFGPAQVDANALKAIVADVVRKIPSTKLSSSQSAQREIQLVLGNTQNTENVGNVEYLTYTLQPYAQAVLDTTPVPDTNVEILNRQLVAPTTLKLDVSPAPLNVSAANANLKVIHRCDGYEPVTFYKKSNSSRQIEVELDYFGKLLIANESGNELNNAYLYKKDGTIQSGALTALIGEAVNGETVRLAKDVNAGALTINNGKTFTLDLNGYTLTTSGISIEDGTKLTLASTGDGYGFVKNSGSGDTIFVHDGTALTIKDDDVTVEGEITREGEKGVVLTAGRYTVDVDPTYYDATKTAVEQVRDGNTTYNVLAEINTITYMVNGFVAHTDTFNFVKGLATLYTPETDATSAFGGWYYDEACAKQPVSAIPAGTKGDKTVYGKFTYRYYAYVPGSTAGANGTGYFTTFAAAAAVAVAQNSTMKLLRAPERDDVFTMPQDSSKTLLVNLGKVENVTLPDGTTGSLEAVDIALPALAANVKAPAEYTLDYPTESNNVVTLKVSDAVAKWSRKATYVQPDADHRNGTTSGYVASFEDALSAVNDADVPGDNGVRYTDVVIDVMQPYTLVQGATIVHTMTINGVSKLTFGENKLQVAANTTVIVDGAAYEGLTGTDATSVMNYGGVVYNWNPTTSKWVLTGDDVAEVWTAGNELKFSYATLEQAVAEAKEGETVKLTKQASNGNYIGRPYTALEQIEIKANGVTIDLQDGSVTSAATYTFRVPKGVTGVVIKNGTITNTNNQSANSRALYTMGAVTLENLTVNTKKTADGIGLYSITVTASGALTIASDDVTVNSSQYDTGDTPKPSIQKISGATVTLTAGYFEDDVSNLLIAGYSSNKVTEDEDPKKGYYHIKSATVAVKLGNGTEAGFADLGAALQAVSDYVKTCKDKSTNVLPSVVTINEELGGDTATTVKLPRYLSNVAITAKEDAGVVLRNMNIIVDENITDPIEYNKVTFTGIEFNNSGIALVPAPSGSQTIKSTDWTIENCHFTNYPASQQYPAVTIEAGPDHELNGLTFTGNNVDSGTCGLCVSDYTNRANPHVPAVKGKVVISENRINPVSGYAVMVEGVEYASGTSVAITGNELVTTINGSTLSLDGTDIDVVTLKDNTITTTYIPTGNDTVPFPIKDAWKLTGASKSVLDVSDNYLTAMPLTLVDTLTATSAYTQPDRNTKATLVAKLKTAPATTTPVSGQPDVATNHASFTYYPTLAGVFAAAEDQYKKDTTSGKKPAQVIYMVSDEPEASAGTISAEADIDLVLNDHHILSQINVPNFQTLTVLKPTGNDKIKNTGVFDHVPTLGDTKADLVLYAGNFNEDVQEYCADGYFASENNPGVWTVIDDPIAKVGNAYFATLQKALEYNETIDDGVIELVRNTTATPNLTTITLAKDQNNLTLTKPVKLVNALENETAFTVAIETAGPVIFAGGLSVGENLAVTVTKATGATSGLVTISGGTSDIEGTVTTTAVGLTVSGAATVVNVTGAVAAGALTLADGAEFNVTGTSEYDKITNTRTKTDNVSRLTAAAVKVTETAAGEAITKLNLKDAVASFASLAIDNANGAQAAIALNDTELTVSGQISMGTTGKDQADTLTLTNKSLLANPGTSIFTVNANDVVYTDATSKLEVYRWSNNGKTVVDMGYVPEDMGAIVKSDFQVDDTAAGMGVFEFTNNEGVTYEPHAYKRTTSGTNPVTYYEIEVGTVVATLTYYDETLKKEVTESYLHVKDALKHASHAEDTIVLQQNAALTEDSAVVGDYDSTSKKLTFDLNGKTLKVYGHGMITVYNSAEDVFKNGIIDISEPTDANAPIPAHDNPVFVMGVGINSLTLNDVRIIGTNVETTGGVFTSTANNSTLALNNVTVTLNDRVSNMAASSDNSKFIVVGSNDVVEITNSTIAVSNFDTAFKVGKTTVDASNVSIYNADFGIFADGEVTVKNASRVSIDAETDVPLILGNGGAVSVEDTSSMPLTSVATYNGNLANLSYAPEATGPYAATLTGKGITFDANDPTKIDSIVKTYATYNDLDSAVKAAEAVTATYSGAVVANPEKATEVVLLRDQSSDKQVTIDKADLVLNLAGKVYTYTGTASPAIMVSGPTGTTINVTFTDSSAASSGTVTADVAYAVEVSAYANLIVEGGNYGGSIGDINGKDVHIERGNFRHSINPIQICAIEAHIPLKHGALQASSSSNVNFPYSVADGTAVARIGANSYAYLHTAIDAANSMGGNVTIELMQSVDLEEDRDVKYNVTFALGNEVPSASIDLKGHVLNVENGITVARGVTITDSGNSGASYGGVVFKAGTSTINGSLSMRNALVKANARLDIGKAGTFVNTECILTLENGSTFTITGPDTISANTLKQITLYGEGAYNISLTNTALTLSQADGLVRAPKQQINLSLDRATLTATTSLDLSGVKNDTTTDPILADSLTLVNSSVLNLNNASATTELSLDKLDTVNIDLTSQIKVGTWTNTVENGGVVTVDVTNFKTATLPARIVDAYATVTETGTFAFTSKSATVNNFMQYVKSGASDDKTDIWVDKAEAVIYRWGKEYKYYLSLQAAIDDSVEKDTIYLVNDITLDEVGDCLKVPSAGSSTTYKSDLTIDGNGHTIKVAAITPTSTGTNPTTNKFTASPMITITGAAQNKTNLLLQNINLVTDTALLGGMITADENSNVTLNNVTLDNAKMDDKNAADYNLVEAAGDLAIGGKFTATLGKESLSVIALTGTTGKTLKTDKTTKTHQTLDLSECTEFTIVKDDSTAKVPTIQDKFLNTDVTFSSALNFVRVYGAYDEANGYNRADYLTGWELADSAKLGSAAVEGSVYNYQVVDAYYATFAGAVDDAKNTENIVEVYKDTDLRATTIDAGLLAVNATTGEKDTVSVAKNGHEPVVNVKTNPVKETYYSVHAETADDITTYTLVEANAKLTYSLSGDKGPFYYETVEEAVATIQKIEMVTNAMVTLLNDVEGDVNITSKHDVTLETAGHTVTGVMTVGENTRLIVDDQSTTKSAEFKAMPVVSDGATLILKGGTYPADVDEFCAGGYSSVENPDHTYTVKQASANKVKVMRGGELVDYYSTFEAALKAATEDDDVIVLVQDLNIAEQVKLALGATRDLTIDLNGYDLTYTATASPVFDVTGGGTLTIMNTIDASSSKATNPKLALINCSLRSVGISLSDYANLTVEGGTITGVTTVVENTSEGTVTVKGGKLEGSMEGILTSKSKAGKIVIQGGEVIGKNSYAILNQGASTIEVSGGNLSGGKDKTNPKLDEDIHNDLGDQHGYTTVTGGNFYHPVPEMQRPGYLSSKNTDPEAAMRTAYPFTVIQGVAVAKIDVYTFTSVADAVAAANDLDTIVIVAEAEEVEMGHIDVDKTVSIDMNRRTLNGSFTVNGGALYLEEGILSNPDGDGVVIMARPDDTTGAVPINGSSALLMLDSKATINAKNAIVLSGASSKDEEHGKNYGVSIGINGTVNGAVTVEKGTTSNNYISVGPEGSINNENGTALTLVGPAAVSLTATQTSGAAIIGSTMGVDLQAGSLTTTAGTFITGGDYGVYATYGDTSEIALTVNGGRFEGNTALYVENKGTRKNDKATVSVKTGTFVAGDGEAIQVVDSNKELTTLVENGYFSKPIANEIVPKEQMCTQRMTVKVTGETADFHYLVEKMTVTLNPGEYAEDEKKAYFVDEEGQPIIDEQTGEYASKTVYVAKGETISDAVPGDLPVLEGYYLSGWTDGKNTYEHDKTAIMTTPLTVTGQWSKDLCSVIVDLNGGTYTGDMTGMVLNDDGTYTISNVPYGTKVSDLIDTTKLTLENYSFIGWKTFEGADLPATAEINEDLVRVEGGVSTLLMVADWRGDDKLVMFYDGTTKIDTITVPYGSSLSDLEGVEDMISAITTKARAIVKEGYRLAEDDAEIWTEKLDLEEKITDLKLYQLNWIEIVYVAQVGDEKFETMEEAIAAAGEDGVIELLADVEYTMKKDEAIRVMENGHKADITPAEGQAVTKLEGTDGTSVFVSVDPVAQVGEEKFGTFGEAAAAAGEEDVIELLADIEEAYVMGDNETIKVMKNDHVLGVEDAEGNAIEGTTDEDGITTFTTVPQEQGEIWIRSRNAILEGAVSIQIKVEPVAESILADKNAKVVFAFNEYPEDTKEIPLSEFTVDTNNGRYGYSAPVQLARFAGDATVTFVDGQGKLISAVVGSKKDDCTEGYTFSLKELCETNRGSDTPGKRLYEALFDYSTASQIYFQQGDWQNLVLDEHVTSVTLDDFKDVPDTVTTPKDDRPEGVKASYNATCEGDHTMNVTFTLPDGKTADDYTFTLDGVEVKPVALEGKYRVEVANIGAEALNVVHKIAVTDGTKTFSVEASLLSYFKGKVEKGEEAIANMGRAILRYNQAALEVVNTQG